MRLPLPNSKSFPFPERLVCFRLKPSNCFHQASLSSTSLEVLHLRPKNKEKRGSEKRIRSITKMEVNMKHAAVEKCAVVTGANKGIGLETVNNAGASGVIVDEQGLKALNIDPASWLSGKATNLVQAVIKQTYEKAEECLNTNYYGCKRVTEALLPLLKLSTLGARIINVSSLRGELKRIPSEKIRNELGDMESLMEDKLDAILEKFLHDLKANALQANGWSVMLPSYSISKATLNAYTRVLAKKYPEMCINCVHPGYVDTDINWHTGTMTVEEGARGSVKLALLPDGGPTGCYFDRTEVADF
ncbi:hypothetical protein VitviT2T_008689 [Vitis vinifera]|uniref:(+)-neomenthol dehydrogenase n=1 Tax=Vitis vinifera TaxID=29760 RepID=A0ABY9C423_VITVI|nr:hypothetical protein VitviT2T_008689 [Vitis vinifera]